MNKTLVVIGGGASGFFCALTAKKFDAGLEVIILEKTSKVLSKVRISGGGRCNVTHGCFEIAPMAKRYPRGGNLVKKTFHQFFTNDTIDWFRERGVLLKTEADGRVFPESDSSETIIACFMKELNRLGVILKLNRSVKALHSENGRWRLELADGTMNADFVCIACGGFPSAASFEWLRAIGHSIAVPVPSLFTFNMPGNPITALMGISVGRAQIKIKGTKLVESGPLLITHWGLSGPAVLRLSAWGALHLAELRYEFEIIINWLCDIKEPEVREILVGMRHNAATQKISGRNPFGMPNRLWDHLLQEAGAKDEWRWADFPASVQNVLIRLLTNHEMKVSGKTTFKEEFVTAGGIQTSEIEPNTMESKLHPNLFFAGEIINVDGITGGYNFQHAWTSGYVAARAIVAKAGDQYAA